MQRNPKSILGLIRSLGIHATGGLALLFLSACASYRPVSDTPVKIGRPYTVRGITYTPAVDPTYDVLGYASWYGNESGNRSANGEKFRAKAVTGAHTTLPLPSYVEVTALDTGRTILVRINDRGPFARGADHRSVAGRGGAARHQGERARGGTGAGGQSAGARP